MARSESRRHDTVKWIITLLVGLVLIAGMAMLFVKLDRQTDFTTIGAEAYSVGTLDRTGEYAESDSALYLRNPITTSGLKCKLVPNATVTYRLYFYDADGKFLSATDEQKGNWSGLGPMLATSVRIVITPIGDNDGKIALYEIWSYANQVTVTVNR